MRLLNFQIDEVLRGRLFAAAARKGESASLYVREAVREKLERDQNPTGSNGAAFPVNETPGEQLKREARERVERKKAKAAV